MSLLYSVFLAQQAIASSQDLDRNKALCFNIVASIFSDNFRSAAFVGLQKADYYLQFKQQESNLVQKKERAASLNIKTKTVVPKTAEIKSAIKNNTPIQKVLIGPDYMKVVVTAYSSTSDQTDNSPLITASNKHVRDGIIAANFLPFGTVVKFPTLFGNKEFVVEDRMKSNTKVDIWFADRESALRFGIKRTEMIIISRPGK